MTQTNVILSSSADFPQFQEDAFLRQMDDILVYRTSNRRRPSRGGPPLGEVLTAPYSRWDTTKSCGRDTTNLHVCYFCTILNTLDIFFCRTLLKNPPKTKFAESHFFMRTERKGRYGEANIRFCHVNAPKLVLTLYLGYARVQLVEALCYKPKDGGFDFRWSLWEFKWT
jgi:hypothetical protein